MSAEVVKAHEVVSDGGLTPIEFTFKGRRFRIHAVLSRWCEAGGWWNRISMASSVPTIKPARSGQSRLLPLVR